VGGPFPPLEFGGPKTSKFQHDFAQLCDLITNVSGTQQYIVSQKTALQTMDTATQANLIRCNLVYKQCQVRLEFWLIQWVAIRLDIATHLVINFCVILFISWYKSQHEQHLDFWGTVWVNHFDHWGMAAKSLHVWKDLFNYVCEFVVRL